MVFRFRPLEVTLTVDEERAYKLGDTIRLRLDLEPRGDVHVREGRVDLVCEQQYWENSTLTMEVPIFHTETRGHGSITQQIGTQTVNKEVKKEFKETLVHSSVVFLNDTRLDSASSSTYDARLVIEPTPPPHAKDARELVKDASRSWTFKWRLVATVDVVRGRNPKRQKTIKVAVE